MDLTARMNDFARYYPFPWSDSPEEGEINSIDAKEESLDAVRRTSGLEAHLHDLRHRPMFSDSAGQLAEPWAFMR